MDTSQQQPGVNIPEYHPLYVKESELASYSSAYFLWTVDAKYYQIKQFDWPNYDSIKFGYYQYAGKFSAPRMQ